MCLLAIQYQSVPEAPILLAHNREENYDRPSQPPRIQSGKPRVICGIDRKAGGTWLGVNQHGLLAVVANRPKMIVPAEPRSRGLLCRELLNFRTAREAIPHAVNELHTGCYAGANYLVADATHAAIVHGGNFIDVVDLEPGLHLLGNGDIDERDNPRQQLARRLLTLQKLDSSVTFLAVASRAFSRSPDEAGRYGVVVRGKEAGTVSSTLLALAPKNQHSIMQHAAGPPDTHPYEDASALLRQVLSTDK